MESNFFSWIINESHTQRHVPSEPPEKPTFRPNSSPTLICFCIQGELSNSIRKIKRKWINFLAIQTPASPTLNIESKMHFKPDRKSSITTSTWEESRISNRPSVPICQSEFSHSVCCVARAKVEYGLHLNLANSRADRRMLREMSNYNSIYIQSRKIDNRHHFCRSKQTAGFRFFWFCFRRKAIPMKTTDIDKSVLQSRFSHRRGCSVLLARATPFS